MNIKKKIINRFEKRQVIIPQVKEVNSEELLKGKVALITGGSGGIGSAIAKELYNSGCKIIITGTRIEKLKKVSKEIGRGTKYVQLNMYNTKEYTAVVEEAVKLFGKIDILVNSAGIHSTNPVQDYFFFTEEEYDNIMAVNLKGPYFFTREVSKYMIKNHIKGHILNITSSTSLEPAWSPYRLSKWGMRGFTEGLAKVLQEKNIIVNGLAPGSTATDLLNYKKGASIKTTDNQSGRYIMPEEVAQYAKMLVSDLGDMVVGDTLFISGGRGITEIR